GPTVRLGDLRGPDAGRDVLLGHDGPVNGAAFSPDGECLLTAGGELTKVGALAVWRIASPDEPLLLRALPVPGKVTQVEFSPDRRRVLLVLQRRGRTGRSFGEVLVWPFARDALAGEPRRLRLADQAVVNWAAFQPGRDRVFAAAQEVKADAGRLVAWDAGTGK